jgi:DNA-binding CsgD family transcriptional regulator
MDIDKLALFSVAVGKLYDAALTPTVWPQALEAIKALLETRTVALISHDILDRTPPWDWHVGYDPEFTRLYFEKYYAQNPFTDEVAQLGAGEMGNSASRADYGAFLETEFYKGWMQPQGYVDGAVLILDKTLRTLSTIVLVRDDQRGAFDDETMAVLGLLYPHIRRAVLIGRVLGEAEARADTLSAVLDSLAAGVFLLTQKGAMAQANVSGLAMLEPGGPARNVNGRLDLSGDDANRALRRALGGPTQAAAELGGQGVAIPVVTTAGEEFMAHLLPLDAERRRAVDAGAEAAFILFLRKLDPTGAAAAAEVARRFGLTPQETRVLRAVVDLGGVPLAADILGVATSTVRTHVTNIFDKTGVRSQAGLVRLLMEAASPFAGRSED